MVMKDGDHTRLLTNNNKSSFSINNHYDINDMSTPATYENELDLTPVQEFYNESNVFITGSTGFLGNILIEKLLRTCPTVKTLFLLIRNKKGKDLEERTDEIFNKETFDLMKKACPKFRHKIVAIAGDCALPGLGLNIEDRKRLIEEVDIVFHAAATVNFDAILSDAVPINVRATRDVLRLAKEIHNLKVLMHVSTIYANCLNQCIEEKVYESTIDPEKVILLAENVPDVLDDISSKLMGKYPNTYTYTKQLAETVVAQESENMPVGIFRPAIVISTYKEPIPGWINNFYGPTGVVAGTAIGILRCLHCDRNVNANLVPVDMCINSLIVTAPKVAETFHNEMKTQKSFKIRVFNYGSTNDAPITWERFMDLINQMKFTLPPSKTIWYPFIRLCKYYPEYVLTTFLLHTLPGILTDSVLFCTGQKPKMMAVYKKIHKFSNVISYFSTQEWQIRSENVLWVENELQERDRKLFLSDLREFHWEDYFPSYCKGVRIFLFKDPLDTLDKGRARMKKLYYVNQTVKVLSCMALLWLSFWFIKILFYGN